MAGFGGVLGAMGGALAPAELEWQRVLQGRRALEQQALFERMQAEQMRSLRTPDAAILPQQFTPLPPQGQAQPPGAPQGFQQQPQPGVPYGYPSPAPASPSPSTGSSAMMPAGLPQANGPATSQPPAGPSVQQTPGGQTPPAGGSPGSVAGTSSEPFDPMKRIKAWAKEIDPKLPPQVQYMMLQDRIRMAQTVFPEEKLLMQGQLQQERIKDQMERWRTELDAKIGMAAQRSQTQITIQGMRDTSGMDRAQLRVGSAEHIEMMREAAREKLAQGQPLDPTLVAFEAEQLRKGNLQGVNEVLGFSRNRAGTMAQIVNEAKRQDPGFDGEKATAALLQFGEQRTAMGTIARTAAPVTIGGNEIRLLAPKVQEASQHVNLTRYPTLNAVIQAANKRTGTPEDQKWLQQYTSYIQTARNAYNLISARGQVTDEVRKTGKDLLDGTMATGALQGALEAFAVEADINKQAVGASVREMSGGQDQVPGSAPAAQQGLPSGWSVEQVGQ